MMEETFCMYSFIIMHRSDTTAVTVQAKSVLHLKQKDRDKTVTSNSLKSASIT